MKETLESFQRIGWPFGMRTKHGKDLKKTKSKTPCPPNKTGNWNLVPHTMKCHNNTELPASSLFHKKYNCMFLRILLIWIFCHLQSNLILTDLGCCLNINENFGFSFATVARAMIMLRLQCVPVQETELVDPIETNEISNANSHQQIPKLILDGLAI